MKLFQILLIFSFLISTCVNNRNGSYSGVLHSLDNSVTGSRPSCYDIGVQADERSHYGTLIHASIHRTTLILTYARTSDKIFKLHKNFNIMSLTINLLLLLAGIELNPGPSSSTLHPRIGSLNICSAVHKAAPIHDVINDQNLAILALNETWMRDDDPLAILNDTAPEGYSVLHMPRGSQGPRGRGGGWLLCIETTSL